MSNEQELPPLPKPWGHYPSHLQIACYTGSQMHDYARAALAATPAPAEPMEMALCEATKVVLREGQLYRFRRVGDCEACAELSRQSLEAYGIGGDK